MDNENNQSTVIVTGAATIVKAMRNSGTNGWTVVFKIKEVDPEVLVLTGKNLTANFTSNEINSTYGSLEKFRQSIRDNEEAQIVVRIHDDGNGSLKFGTKFAGEIIVPDSPRQQTQSINDEIKKMQNDKEHFAGVRCGFCNNGESIGERKHCFKCGTWRIDGELVANPDHVKEQ